MIQGGDPTGTGKGGTSIWGKKFNDEIRESLKVSTSAIREKHTVQIFVFDAFYKTNEIGHRIDEVYAVLLKLMDGRE